jgi:hypothetical protein
LRKSVIRLLVFALSATFLASVIVSTPVKAPVGGVVWIVPSVPTPTLASAVAVAGPNDEIHVLNGHFEALGANLVIPQTNLWIISAPPQLGPVPNIDLNGFSIIVTGIHVFIWGLNITDSVGSPYGILLIPPASDCIIMANTMTGLVPASVGIEVALSNNNIIVLNNMSYWGICIRLDNMSEYNTVKGNTLTPPEFVGIEVANGAAFNKIYWNNLMVAWDVGIELQDANPPGSPANYFDDTTGGGPPGLHKGNFEITWAIPSPFPVPGPNGYMDNWPLAVPWTQLPGDINVDGRVSLQDLVLLANSYLKVWCNLLWDPRCDLTGNSWGTINLRDLVILARNYGKVYP